MNSSKNPPVELVQAAGFNIWRQHQVSPTTVAHSHTDIEGFFLFDGSITYTLNGRSVDVSSGQLVWFWGGFPHQVLRSNQVDGVWITLPLEQWFSWALPTHITENLFNGKFVTIPKETFTKKTFTRWVDDIKSKSPERDQAALLEIHAGLLRLASEGTILPSRGIQRGSRSLEKTLVWIHRNYRENITTEQMASAAGLHPKYLMRMFRAQLGMTLWEYITQQRIAYAQRLLLSTECTTLDAAYEAGFQSLAPFYLAFKKQTQGQTPSQFRRIKMRGPMA